MDEKTKSPRDPKERILEAATRLFARQCYAATGMRELAQEADVNLAMINYYFGSKHKILETLIREYFNSYIEIAKRCFSGEASPEDKLREFVREAIGFMRKNSELVLVSLNEFPYEMHELAVFKAEHIEKIQQIIFKELLPTMQSVMERPFRLEIIVPAVAGMMLMHFIMKPIIEKLPGIQLDDEFYEEYIEEITNMVMYGLLGRPEPHETNK